MICLNVFVVTATQSLNLYNLALKHFKNEAEAIAFVKEIEVILDKKLDAKKDTSSTKVDITRLEVKIAQPKINMIKWVFAFFVSLALLILGLYIKK